jgi:hypothetical protein
MFVLKQVAVCPVEATHVVCCAQFNRYQANMTLQETPMHLKLRQQPQHTRSHSPQSTLALGMSAPCTEAAKSKQHLFLQQHITCCLVN